MPRCSRIRKLGFVSAEPDARRSEAELHGTGLSKLELSLRQFDLVFLSLIGCRTVQRVLRVCSPLSPFSAFVGRGGMSASCAN